jgi:hypothetical protein
MAGFLLLMTLEYLPDLPSRCVLFLFGCMTKPIKDWLPHSKPARDVTGQHVHLLSDVYHSGSLHGWLLTVMTAERASWTAPVFTVFQLAIISGMFLHVLSQSCVVLCAGCCTAACHCPAS